METSSRAIIRTELTVVLRSELMISNPPGQPCPALDRIGLDSWWRGTSDGIELLRLA